MSLIGNQEKEYLAHPKKPPKILVADDDSYILETFKIAFEKREDTSLYLCSSPKEALSLLQKNPFLFAMAFVDYHFTHDAPPEGHELARQMKAINPCICVCLMSGDHSPEALEQWLKAGVDKFIYKPLNKDFITSMTSYAVESWKAQFSISWTEHSQRRNIEKIQEKIGLIGISENIHRVSNQTMKYAPTNESVLILGETGTGKEIVAKAIHTLSKRSEGPFIPVNCAAIAENLFESELFGHIKGAFTGAYANKKGKFESAHEGTLFLDEIHHLSLNQQAKILRVLQERKVLPVGSHKEIPINFRLICASKPDLEAKSEKKEFLIDLYYRISTLDTQIAPLREHTEDIKPLIHFFQKKGLMEGLPQKVFLPSSIRLLHNYKWLGNVRELEKLVRKLSITVEGSSIEKNHLPDKFQMPEDELEDLTETKPNSKSVLKENVSFLTEKTEPQYIPTRLSIKEDTSSSFFQESKSLCTSFPELEKKQKQEMIDFILYALHKTDHNISKAAKMMSISRTTLNSRIKAFNLYDKIKRL